MPVTKSEEAYLGFPNAGNEVWRAYLGSPVPVRLASVGCEGS
jgi:hypothetical protein